MKDKTKKKITQFIIRWLWKHWWNTMYEVTYRDGCDNSTKAALKEADRRLAAEFLKGDKC